MSMSGTALRAVNAWYWRENGEALTKAALDRIEQNRIATQAERDRMKASLDVKALQAEAIRKLEDDSNLPQRRAYEDQQEEADKARAAFEKEHGEKRGWFERTFDAKRRDDLKKVEALERKAVDLKETADIGAAPKEERLKVREQVKYEVDKRRGETTLALEDNQDRLDALGNLKYRINMDQEKAPELVRTVMRSSPEAGVSRAIKVMERSEDDELHAREAAAQARKDAYKVEVTDFEGTHSDGRTDPHDLQGAYHRLGEQRESAGKAGRHEENHEDKRMMYRHRYGLEWASERIASAREEWEADKNYVTADKVLKAQAGYDALEAGFAKEAWKRVEERGESRPTWNHASAIEDARNRSEAAGEAETASQDREQRIKDGELSTASKVTRSLVPGGEDMTTYEGFRADDGIQELKFDNPQIEAEYTRKRDDLNRQRAERHEQREGREPSRDERPVQHAPEEKPESRRGQEADAPSDDERPAQHMPTGEEEHAATFRHHEALDKQAHEEAIAPKGPTDGPTDEDGVKR